MHIASSNLVVAMKVAKSDQESAQRIRNNQRRSRQRRKDLIHELQERLSRYDAKEIQATQVMQAAARKVVEENLRLKTLLAQNGIPFEDHSLTTDDQKHIIGSSKTAPLLRNKSAKDHDTTMVSCDYQSASNQRSPELKLDFKAGNVCLSQNNHSESSNTGRDHGCCVSSLMTSEEGCGNLSEAKTREKQPKIPFQLQTSRVSLEATRNSSSMSCEDAARIISGMSMDGDLLRARSQLGCSSNDDCTVQNVEVMRIMDKC